MIVTQDPHPKLNNASQIMKKMQQNSKSRMAEKTHKTTCKHIKVHVHENTLDYINNIT